MAAPRRFSNLIDIGMRPSSQAIDTQFFLRSHYYTHFVYVWIRYMTRPLAEPEFVLKAMPPQLSKSAIARRRLSLHAPVVQGSRLLLVQAPAGFGKTVLLSQWRREWLQQGVPVAWLTLDERDEGARLVAAMRYSILMAISLSSNLATHNFDGASLSDPIAAATELLAEVAAMPTALALILDDAHTLRHRDVEGLIEYFACNAPANLTLALSSRVALSLPTAGLIGNTECVTLDAQALRLTSQEGAAILEARFGKSVDVDMAASLHETCSGWPLGLQLMSSAIACGATARNTLELASRAKQGVEKYFAEFLLNRLPQPLVDVLLRVSLVEGVNPAFCAAIVGRPTAADQLKALCASTPVFSESLGSDWVTLHPLAREFLRARANQELPSFEVQLVHERAALWLAQQELDEQAALHALAAGHKEQAYELVERGLYKLALQGHRGRVRAWLDRLPDAEIAARPRLALAAGIVMPVVERDRLEWVLDVLGTIRTNVEMPSDLRREATRVIGGVELRLDNLDRVLELSTEQMETLPTGLPYLDERILNLHATLLMLTGRPDLARHRCASAHSDAEGLISTQLIFASVVSRSYLWQGQVALAADSVTKVLNDAQAQLGRRSALATVLAATLAAAMWELDRPDAAANALADRLDVLAADAQPHSVVIGFITASRIAGWEGHEAKRLNLLDYLCVMGESRRWPRVTLEALAELVATHARAGHVKSCRVFLARAEAAHAAAMQQNPKTLARSLDLRLHMCRAYTDIARHAWEEAQRQLEYAALLASDLKCGREDIECKLLQSLAMHRLGRDPRELLHEAIGLAQALGMTRIVTDTHPDLAAIIPATLHPARTANSSVVQHEHTPAARHEAMVAPTELLTPKEREVLGLMSLGLQNKQIAVASAVSQETIKWHIKNLFAKLGAVNRRHAVARALMLGILISEH
ncbi:LuxR family maltose regulon positive regulatory protein [Variovorax boronicumulans]|uniref:LuxR C-terminal-related transcriptional regulator n=1 Tax=Variovorax boronicumulans TaxID=436515 RepID=UPI00278AF7A0|nr:LuxR C-terminal-related transcriptional regulator [Variovorax boronicumulans]MDQ0086057.1 LuxR family maltose regulon positive regulatory protein [Variovorax boronicumulans]